MRTSLRGARRYTLFWTQEQAMSDERTYLELSEEGGGSHKFYEVVVSGNQVRVRYG